MQRQHPVRQAEEAAKQQAGRQEAMTAAQARQTKPANLSGKIWQQMLSQRASLRLRQFLGHPQARYHLFKDRRRRVGILGGGWQARQWQGKSSWKGYGHHLEVPPADEVLKLCRCERPQLVANSSIVEELAKISPFESMHAHQLFGMSIQHLETSLLVQCEIALELMCGLEGKTFSF